MGCHLLRLIKNRYMKKIILISFVLIASLSFLNVKGNTINAENVKYDTLPTQELIVHLQNMNIESYYGKPVDSFLLALPANLYNMRVYGGTNSQGAIFRASEMIVDFTPIRGGGPNAIIHVREFIHLNRYSPNATWDVSLFRKEKIYRIDIYKDQNTCINGSCL